MKKILQFKELLIIIGMAIGGLLYLDDRYVMAGEHGSLKESHQKLEQRVLGNELEQAHQKALDNWYFHRSQARKYPNDAEVKERSEKAYRHVNKLERQIGKLAEERKSPKATVPNPGP